LKPQIAFDKPAMPGIYTAACALAQTGAPAGGRQTGGFIKTGGFKKKFQVSCVGTQRRKCFLV